MLSIPALASRAGFTYLLTNGVVFPGYIRSGGPPPPPEPSQPYFNFVVSNSTDTLVINGTVTDPCPGCADIPDVFQHADVIAVRLPTPTIRTSEVEICWDTASNRTYQVQYRSSLTTNVWTYVGPPVIGDGSRSCFTDKVPVDQPQRYYRVVPLP